MGNKITINTDIVWFKFTLLCNLDKEQSAPLSVDLRGMEVSKVNGRILTAKKMNAINTLEDHENVEWYCNDRRESHKNRSYFKGG